MTDLTSEGFGNVPNTSEPFGNLPHDAETFRTFPKDSETFGTLRKVAERTDHHTLSVREVARMFEEANVARTERSITNWCQPNRQGVARLNAYFDSNERRYFITPQSVTRAIEEEKSKMSNGATTPPPPRDIPNSSESQPREERSQPSFGKSSEIKEDITELEHQIRDLEINNRAKDFYIERLQNDRDSFNNERQKYIGQLMSQSRQIGEMETQLLQIGAPVSEARKSLPHGSELHENTIPDDFESQNQTSSSVPYEEKVSITE